MVPVPKRSKLGTACVLISKGSTKCLLYMYVYHLLIEESPRRKLVWDVSGESEWFVQGSRPKSRYASRTYQTDPLLTQIRFLKPDQAGSKSSPVANGFIGCGALNSTTQVPNLPLSPLTHRVTMAQYGLE